MDKQKKDRLSLYIDPPLLKEIKKRAIDLDMDYSKFAESLFKAELVSAERISTVPISAAAAAGAAASSHAELGSLPTEKRRHGTGMG